MLYSHYEEFIFFVLSFGILFPISAQKKKERDTSSIIQQLNRIEFKKNRDRSDFYVISGKEDGLLVAEETYDIAPKGGYVWKFHLIDTAFNLVWSKEEVVPVQGSLIGYEYFGGNFYLLFNRNQFRSEQLLVLQYTAHDEEVKSYELTTVFP